MNKAKEHYTEQYHPQIKMSPINKKTYEFIKSLEIKTAFEFGCNTGRHLLKFRKMGIKSFGIDINSTSIFYARFLNKLENVEVADELSFKNIPDNSFDMVFTNSVLCHIEYIDDILKNLKRISKKHLIMVEAIKRQGTHWWPHNYPGEKIFLEKSIQNKLYILSHYDKCFLDSEKS